MIKVQILDNESMIKYADLDNCEVWLLNRTETTSLDSRIVNKEELTESLLPNTEKFPQLLTFISEAHPPKKIKVKDFVPETIDDKIVYNQNGTVKYVEKEFDTIKSTFTYEIITPDKDKFIIQAYVCDRESLVEINS